MYLALWGTERTAMRNLDMCTKPSLSPENQGRHDITFCLDLMSGDPKTKGCYVFHREQPAAPLQQRTYNHVRDGKWVPRSVATFGQAIGSKGPAVTGVSDQRVPRLGIFTRNGGREGRHLETQLSAVQTRFYHPSPRLWCASLLLGA